MWSSMRYPCDSEIPRAAGAITHDEVTFEWCYRVWIYHVLRSRYLIPNLSLPDPYIP